MKGAVVKNPLDEKMYYIYKGKRYLLSCETKFTESDSKRNLCHENIALEDECIDHPEWPSGGEYKEGMHDESENFCNKVTKSQLRRVISTQSAQESPQLRVSYSGSKAGMRPLRDVLNVFEMSN